MTVPLLKIEHLEVRYGDLIGVSDVSLDVPEGSVVALLGSNGGGKDFAGRRSAARARFRSCARV
jgi:ABC-type branched-subunit amino acid transport system ATPase component